MFSVFSRLRWFDTNQKRSPLQSEFLEQRHAEVDERAQGTPKFSVRLAYGYTIPTDKFLRLSPSEFAVPKAIPDNLDREDPFHYEQCARPNPAFSMPPRTHRTGPRNLPFDSGHKPVHALDHESKQDIHEYKAVDMT